MAALIKVDDGDMDAVKYAGAWKSTTDLDTTQVFKGTTHGTVQNGATISFAFNGTSVAWIGILGSTNGSRSVVDLVLDGDPASASVVTAQPLADAAAFLQTQTLYASPPLATGAHTVVVTARDVQQDHIRFDYVEYTPDGAGAEATGASAGVAPPPSSAALPPPSSSQLSSSSPRPSARLGTIVPAVLVPCLVLLLLAGALLAWRRHRRRRAPKAFDVHVNPFDAAPDSGSFMSPRASKIVGQVAGRHRIHWEDAARLGESPPPYPSSSARVDESATAVPEPTNVRKW
ncbi:hypothetical protein PsYK624_099440 [Phanerochaete sordida]|uniref:Uncharacterized protein n=1 Tax=Phanerochaete sordida TaxID=48140 RepID=A0A9P3GCW4_9APHY|nr:hypothetical protein PsYK624_099440 [Phanerochaete sordida]